MPKRVLPELTWKTKSCRQKCLTSSIVTMSDFENAVKEVMPSAMREVYLGVAGHPVVCDRRARRGKARAAGSGRVAISDILTSMQSWVTRCQRAC